MKWEGGSDRRESRTDCKEVGIGSGKCFIFRFPISAFRFPISHFPLPTSHFKSLFRSAAYPAFGKGEGLQAVCQRF